MNELALFIYNEPCTDIDVPPDCWGGNLGNRQLDALVAEKVMGCKVEWVDDRPFCTCPSIRNVRPHEKRNLTLAYSSGFLAQYSYRWEDVTELIEEMHLSDMWLDLKSPFHAGAPWWAGFTPHYTTGWNGIPDFKAAGTSGPGAISRAALLWATFQDR